MINFFLFYCLLINSFFLVFNIKGTKNVGYFTQQIHFVLNSGFISTPKQPLLMTYFVLLQIFCLFIQIDRNWLIIVQKIVSDYIDGRQATTSRSPDIRASSETTFFLVRSRTNQNQPANTHTDAVPADEWFGFTYPWTHIHTNTCMPGLGTHERQTIIL